MYESFCTIFNILGEITLVIQIGKSAIRQRIENESNSLTAAAGLPELVSSL